MIVVLHPQGDPLPGFLKVLEPGSVQKLLQDALPEALDLAQGHRVVRLAAQVVDLVLLQLPLELGAAPPGGVLPPVVGEHFTRTPVVAHRPTVGLQHRIAGLGAVQPQSHDVAGVVVDVADQVHRLAPQPEAHDVALPHLVRRAPLEEARLARIAHRLAPGRLDQVRFLQRRMHRARCRLHQEQAFEDIADSPGSPTRILPLELQDLLPHGTVTGAAHTASLGQCPLPQTLNRKHKAQEKKCADMRFCPTDRFHFQKKYTLELY